MKKENLGFKFERKRKKKKKFLPPLCPDYRPKSSSSNFCALADDCKNATFFLGEFGNCQGGTDPRELEERRERVKEKVK